MFLAFISQYLNKLIESKIGDFTSPKPFHAVKVQSFKDNRIKSLAQVVCEFPLKIKTLIRNFAIEPCELIHRTPPTSRSFLFSRQRLVEMSKFFQGLFQWLRVLYLLTRRKCQIRVFHTKVCPNTLTRCWQRFCFYKVGDEIKPIVTASVAFYCDTTDISMPLAMLMERIRNFIMSPFPFLPFSEIEGEAIVFQCPTCLFERQGLEPMPFLNLGSAPKFLEKTLVGKVYPFQFFLHGLTWQYFPMWMRCTLQFGQMFTHRSVVRIRQTIFIALTLPLMEILMHLPHIVKQIAKPYQIRLISELILIRFHGISHITPFYPFPVGWQTRHQAVTLEMFASVIVLIIPQF